MVRHLDRRQALALVAKAGGAALAAPWLGACAPPPPPRLVVLLGACSVNAGYLGAYGGPPGLTPQLDRFAAGAAVLERHVTEAAQSGIAYASIMTGGHADHHGVFDHPSPLAAGVETVTSVFAAAGWEVAYWSGQAMAAHDLGYARGVAPDHCRPHPLTADDPLLGELLARLARDPAARALVVATFTTTHMRYTEDPFWFGPTYRAAEALPDQLRALGLDAAEVVRYRQLLVDHTSNFALSTDLAGTLARWGLDAAERRAFRAVMDYLYRCAVRRLDEVVGAIVARLDEAALGGASAVVVTADHGEALGRDNLLFPYSHGYQLAPEELRVPLLVRAPGVGARRVAGVTRSVDLLPTLAALARVELPAGAAPLGVDLGPWLRGRAGATGLDAFSHTGLLHRAIVASPDFPGSSLERSFPRRDPACLWLARRRGDVVAKRVRDPRDGRFRLVAFDLADDPEERVDLAASPAPWHEVASAELEAYRARLAAAWRQRGPASGLGSDEERRRLEALGYLPPAPG